MWANVLLYPEHFGHWKSLCPINIIFPQAVPSFEVQQRDGGCVFSFLLGPAATTRGKVEGWLIPCCCCGLGKEAGYPYPPGPADTMTPGEGRERMEMSASPTYHYLIPLHDAEWRWRLSSSPAPTTLPRWGYQSTDGFRQTGNGGTVFHSAPPTLSLQRTRSTASCCWGGRENYLPPWHHPEGVRVLSASVKWRELMGDGLEAQFLVQPC